MSVGLLPEVDPDKIVYVGNGSLMGAWMSELSNHIRKELFANTPLFVNCSLTVR